MNDGVSLVDIAALSAMVAAVVVLVICLLRYATRGGRE